MTTGELFEMEPQDQESPCCNSPSLSAEGRRSQTGLLARLCAAISTQAPVGYEDETGFHYGSEVR